MSFISFTAIYIFLLRYFFFFYLYFMPLDLCSAHLINVSLWGWGIYQSLVQNCNFWVLNLLMCFWVSWQDALFFLLNKFRKLT